MGLLIVYATLFLPVVILVVTWPMSAKRAFLGLGLCLVLVTVFGCIVGGLTPLDILRMDSHGTITLLILYASYLITAVCFLVRLIHWNWRKKHPPEPEYVEPDYYQEVIDEQ